MALVVGNGAYAKVRRLPNPTSDAKAMEALFKAAGFDIVSAREDLGNAAMRRALRDFSDHVRDAAIAVVFYAGHGIEVNGRNYLIPVDAILERDIDVEDETVSLERVAEVLEQATRLRLVILDACRDNPFLLSIKRTIAGRSIGRGLAEVRVFTADTLIAFAAKAGSIAADGVGDNSPYTIALVEHLTTPGLDLRLALGRVRDAVLKSTANRQEPFVYGSLGGAEIPLVVARISEATQEWSRVDKTSMPELETFVRRHASSPEAEYARARITALTKQVTMPEPPKPKLATSSQPAPATPCDGAEVAVGATERKCLKPGAGKVEWFKDCARCPEMVVVPAGEFTMGSNDGGADEKPVHKVTIVKPLAVGKFEVTFSEWDTCVAAGGCKHKPADRGWGRGRQPVIGVSWDDVTKDYLPWLSRSAGKAYRLLTEAEWEYSARASTTSPFWWGAEISTLQANYSGKSSSAGGDKGQYRQRTLPVDSFKSNPWGLYNVHGNAREWVQDCYKESYLGAPSDGRAVPEFAHCKRGVRSGSWDYGPQDLRSAFRDWDGQGSRDYFVGFRVARTLE